MNKNIEQLKKWEQDISEFNKYSISRAKSIIHDIKEEPDLVKKNNMRKDLILGTLYVIKKFIYRSGFLCLNSSLYDMEDILNSCVEIWIKYIDNGRIESIDNFSAAFTTSFYSNVIYNTISSKFPIADFTVLSTEDFEDVFYSFLEQKKKNKKFSYEDFIEIIETKHRHTMKVLEYLKDGKRLQNTYSLFNSIYKSLYNINLPLNRIGNIKYLMIESGLELLKKDLTDDYEELFYDGVYITDIDTLEDDNDFLECLYDSLDEYEISVLKRRYGMGIMEHTLEEIGIEDKITKESARLRHNKILEKAREIYKKNFEPE